MTVTSTEKLFVKGNEAVAMAAIEAGCRCYFGYPITPQSDIPEYLSRELPKSGGEFLQAESEIGAINMLLGASATGVRAMTSSSGPGISLKQEGISYMAGSELPGVIIDIMRSGPGLGGIDASQADYWQATRGGGHGGYRIIVLAPASVQEMYDLTMLAFDLSDIYRMPAMVLSDSVVGQMKESIVANPRAKLALPEKNWVVRGRAEGEEQKIVKSLHLGDGEMEAFHWQMDARYHELADKECRWEEVETADAELIVTAFGSTSRIAKTAIVMAREAGMKVGLIRPISLFPFPKKAYAQLSERCKLFLDIELSTGQMIDDVRLSVARDAEVAFYGRPPGAGSLPTPEELFEQIRKNYRATA
ncbi:MAG: 3-methyl-2-oxobutanoate dehydrogenase subunit VorB [Desulfuromonadaceae bacterium]|nr:3-methyl-2-oxobutanoate dehydrogenase subunit VorB [Desulfuromonadaceae bacterium]MDD2855178.1 3-methyl-2-oxobutanoate dehydrogenase subunit VorB [Desulfuromonadaceae bacterium]